MPAPAHRELWGAEGDRSGPGTDSKGRAGCSCRHDAPARPNRQRLNRVSIEVEIHSPNSRAINTRASPSAKPGERSGNERRSSVEAVSKFAATLITVRLVPKRLNVSEFTMAQSVRCKVLAASGLSGVSR